MGSAQDARTVAMERLDRLELVTRGLVVAGRVLLAALALLVMASQIGAGI